jgi:glycosyltransferase involved in cell wall biosynthesis
VCDKVREVASWPSVDAIVVVDDGSEDGTAEQLARLGIPQLEIVSHPRNLGTPSAKNSGAARITNEWVAFLDDDDLLPPDYLATLKSTAEIVGADVISAPARRLPHLDPAVRYDELIGRLSLADGPQEISQTEFAETPFIGPNCLVRQKVLSDIAFDKRYRGNFWREETDFYVSAASAGFRVGQTEKTCYYVLGKRSGGSHGRCLVTYEYWVYRNNWRFLKKHRRYLVDSGAISGVLSAQLALGRRRFAKFAVAAAGRFSR